VRLRALLVAAALAVAGCGGNGSDAASPDAGGQVAGPSGQVSGVVTVLAAASLTEAFTTLAETFERTHDGTEVRLSFAASSELATQITQGAPADVFAAASPATMQQVVDAGDTVGEPAVFARNRLQIVTPAGNPAGVTGLADFARPELKIALCAEQVPCGAAARQAFEAAGVTPRPDTLEEDVRATLTKVTLGEVDAALVYRTDVMAAGEQVEGIDFPESADAVNDYPIAAVRDAPNPEAAQAWIDLVVGDAGQAVLRDAGFEAP
jgi:molybdate transport system substrate-binding protein